MRVKVLNVLLIEKVPGKDYSFEAHLPEGMSEKLAINVLTDVINQLKAKADDKERVKER